MSGYAETKARCESFRFELRRETRTEHARLDKHPAFVALFAGTLGFEEYRQLMTAFHGYYQQLDALILRACEAHRIASLGFTYEPRSSILVRDLAALGAIPSLNDGSGTQKAVMLDSLQSLAGTLYVFEGSLLGGSVMLGPVDALLERAGRGGNGYWKWCRDIGGKRWAMTCQLLDHLDATDEAKRRMIDAARTAFCSFADWLEGGHAQLLDEGSKRC